MRLAGVIAIVLSGGMTCSAQVPSGAHSVDDHSREDAVNTQIAAAETALEQQDFKAAEASLKTLVTIRPHDARVLYDLGFAQERTGEQEDAAKSYAAAIAANPDLAEPRVALGLLDARAGKVDAAHRELTEAANLMVASPELRGRALRALAALDESTHPELAQDELLQAIKLTGETPADVSMSAEMANHAGDASDAEVAYRRALKLNAGDPDAVAGLAHALQQENKLPEAEAVLTEALKERPNDPRLVSQLASVCVAEDKAKDAIPLLQQLRAEDPKYAEDPAVTRLLARVYAVNGDDSSAEKLYAGLVANSPKDPELLDDLGSVLVKEQKYAEAEGVLARAVALRDEFHDDAAWGTAAAHLAFAASKNGHPQVTLQALAARATVLPNSPSVLFLKAISYDALHQRKQATEAYRAFLAVAEGKFPDQEFQARHRLVALQNER